MCLSTVQISNASQKLKKKQAEVPHMFELSFKNCKRVQASSFRIEYRIV